MSVQGKMRTVTTQTFAEMKARGEKISMLTSYDFTLARWVDASGIEGILVGDSAANVMAGFQTTVPMPLEAMIYHAQCVTRAVKHAMVVVDMPFGSYHGSVDRALDAAVRIMRESQAQALKLEGGESIVPVVQALVRAGIPVMGHLGLTPQSINCFGCFGVRAKEEKEAERLLHDAQLLEEAGAFALVLEKIPATLAEQVTQQRGIATIGIGAGANVDGQILVLHDMLGLTQDFSPKFLRRYAELGQGVEQACKNYIEDVKAGRFPSPAEQY